MKLQTQIPLTKADHQIDYASKLFLLGSCFSENMGAKLDYYKFQTVQNPFGILFHPLAIENLISRAIKKQFYSENEVFFLNDRWHCFDAHSSVSDISKEKLLGNLNAQLRVTQKKLQEATHIIITLGTAWTYTANETGKTVANCHKVPQKEFNKLLLSVDEITFSLQRIAHQIETVNKNAQLIFTISPVRHLKDGFIENQRSKSHLITALNNLLGDPSFGARGYYFPSYEIMMDELRDYRFYAADMVHPNELAIDYIWEKFRTVWISDAVRAIMKKVEEVQRGLRHRAFNPEGLEHRKFRVALQDRIAYLKDTYPFMEFDS
ncbi:GSCFA domain-containing protein [Maribacter chungangensis]|uniref:GSCFA domain-containing protein n=1 Tax=Maribacter chungangensis TaxID=1069117 RepID=A0ABW3B6H9_9FLAO